MRRVALFGLLGVVSCTTTSGGGGAGIASEAEWRTLRQPRPDPLDDAPRVTLSSMQFLGEVEWPEGTRVSAELGVGELVVANLLARRDIRFVERRRFSAVSDAVRQGRPAPPNRPPLGVSSGAHFGVVAVWVPTTAERASVEIRVDRLETGEVGGATRVEVDRGANPVALARAVTRGITEVLDELGLRPGGPNPAGEANAAPNGGVSDQALRHFLRGLAAEETWNWEAARRGYQAALAAERGFHEAGVALARTARLRLGGTLGES